MDELLHDPGFAHPGLGRRSSDLELHVSLPWASKFPSPPPSFSTSIQVRPPTSCSAAALACGCAGTSRTSAAEFCQNVRVQGTPIYVPLNPATSYKKTKPFAHELARLLERLYPRRGRL